MTPPFKESLTPLLSHLCYIVVFEPRYSKRTHTMHYGLLLQLLLVYVHTKNTRKAPGVFMTLRW